MGLAEVGPADVFFLLSVEFAVGPKPVSSHPPENPKVFAEDRIATLHPPQCGGTVDDARRHPVILSLVALQIFPELFLDL